KDIVTRLHSEITTAVRNAKVSQALVKLGTQPLTNTPDEFAAFIKAEPTKYAKIIDAAKITPA
ncbi:MAG TPA: tripartite tricarboxylate transporter substrate-binding protein, partial [Steroidobacteraceae bacterium]|nr:tripartite tricarboxylate transporter substrate-binding protein [Steroidobacteraceae bacterium]